MYNILEYVSTIDTLQTYINLKIERLFEKHEIEWIYRNCSKDVIDLFHRTYKFNSFLMEAIRHIIGYKSDSYRSYLEDSTFDPSLFTYEELVILHKNGVENIHDNAVRYYIKKGYCNLIPKRYRTYDIQILQDLEKIGIVIDYASIVEYTDSDDIDPYIIRRCFELGVDVMFYPTPCNIREIIKYSAPENVWDMLFTNLGVERNCPKFMDILVENNIPIHPSIFNYVDKHLGWVFEHINYFSDEDILNAYLMSYISLDVIERIDYWNIVPNFPIAMNMGVWNNIRRLKRELHKDIIYILSFGNITYTDPLLLWISNQRNVDYTRIIEVNITNAILVLHYLQDIKISIRGISGNSTILQMAKLYTEGYRRLCDKYGEDNTVKYAIELVNKNTKITIKPGFEDILINTSN